MRCSLPFMVLVLSFLPIALAQPHNQGSRTEQNPATVRSPDSTKADVAVPLCPAKFEDGLEKDRIAFRGENGVSPPQPTYVPPAETSDELRRKEGAFYFDVVMNGIVDVDGAVQDVCLSRSAGYGLDASAANSMRKARFKPATKGGKPVPFRTDFEVDFRQDN